ncbi:MAG TPA: MarR family winged helix-turn-helix transcriptional regulator, partial [Streptosporangiaceae bacterium]
PSGDGAQPGGAQPSRDGAQPSRDGATVALTPAGHQAADRLNDAREAGISRLMAGWEPDMNPELRQLLGRITKKLVATDGPPEREAAAVPQR